MGEAESMPSMTTDAFPAMGDVGRRFVKDGQKLASETDRRRQLLAQWCRSMGDQVAGKTPASTQEAPGASMPSALVVQKTAKLPPRQRQTLDRLLAGDSEKQIAARLEVSKHTVHIYVKSLYRRFGVCSRGELLAQFVAHPRSSPV